MLLEPQGPHGSLGCDTGAIGIADLEHKPSSDDIAQIAYQLSSTDLVQAPGQIRRRLLWHGFGGVLRCCRRLEGELITQLGGQRGKQAGL